MHLKLLENIDDPYDAVEYSKLISPDPSKSSILEEALKKITKEEMIDSLIDIMKIKVLSGLKFDIDEDVMTNIKEDLNRNKGMVKVEDVEKIALFGIVMED